MTPDPKRVAAAFRIKTAFRLDYPRQEPQESYKDFHQRLKLWLPMFGAYLVEAVQKVRLVDPIKWRVVGRPRVSVGTVEFRLVGKSTYGFFSVNVFASGHRDLSGKFFGGVKVLGPDPDEIPMDLGIGQSGVSEKDFKPFLKALLEDVRLKVWARTEEAIARMG